MVRGEVQVFPWSPVPVNKEVLAGKVPDNNSVTFYLLFLLNLNGFTLVITINLRFDPFL